MTTTTNWKGENIIVNGLNEKEKEKREKSERRK